jgi:2-oxoglutarate dehydrogenase E2 component (dihydrolipoamide succinyltransferase)
MILEIRIPSPGESITEVAIGNWFVQDGDRVEKDQEIADVETDKATLPLIATGSGRITIVAKAGVKIEVGDVACTIDTDIAAGPEKSSPVHTAPQKTADSKNHTKNRKEVTKQDVVPSAGTISLSEKKDSYADIRITPLARKRMEENNLSVDDIIKGLRKITTDEVDRVLMQKHDTHKQSVPDTYAERRLEKTPMSPLRRKLARRLVAVKNETAMLTTFNEVDMSDMLDLRKKYQQVFQEKHGVKLGLMSFFAKAVSKALIQFPHVNAAIEGDDIVTPSYVDLGIAVQTDKGLMVPIIRNAASKSLAQIEKEIAELAGKARASRLTLDEMTGGTFTITNGGVFGSMLSTPILNPPQSAILGMHNIVERPVAVQGKVEIRPIMYVALSYDHRIIDGADSVRFLVKVKEYIETPLKMLMADDPEKDLLEL